MSYQKPIIAVWVSQKNLGFLYNQNMAKRRGFPPVYKIERVAKMSAKCAFFGVLQKIVVICCAIFFGFANAFAANLPAGYTELEYIESTGTQYIDTGFAPTTNYKHTIVFETLSGGTGYLCGTGSAGGRSGNVKLTGNNILDIYNDSGIGSVGILRNVQLAQGKNTLVLDLRNASKSYVSLNGVNLETINTDTYITSSRSVTLFGSGAASSVPLRIYESIIEQNGVVIAHFVPAKNSSGVIGMYDLVSGTFFTNAGSGTFTAGPEVLNPCRNLFDSAAYLSATISSGGTITAMTGQKLYYTKVLPNNSYVFNYTTSVSLSGNVVWGYAKDMPTIGGSATYNYMTIQNIKNNVFDVPAGYNYLLIRLDATNFVPNMTNIQLEEGSTATAYVPYNASCHNTNGIKIATTAYNTAQFNPVVNDLNTTIATIRDVVTNTINQTAAIADLQATKQTRPADDYTDETNTENCPKFRQCLLVEDNNNIPHWYLIKDPVRDLVKSLRDNKINSDGEITTTAYAANGTTNSRYYKGYPAMRKLADGSTSVHIRQFTSAMLNGTNGGQYKTLSDQEWAVTWNGNETGTAGSFLPGVIYGTSRCAKTRPSSTAVGTEGWNTIENSDPVNDAENIQSYVQCYCKMTGVGVDGEFTPVRDSSRAPWVFTYTNSSAADCADYCAADCSSDVRLDASIRSAVLGFAAN